MKAISCDVGAGTGAFKDVRQLLATARRKILSGVSIVFSGVYPKAYGAGDRWHALAIRVSAAES